MKYGIKRAVGTQYVGLFWRTYGTQENVHLLFYPYFVPNGTIDVNI